MYSLPTGGHALNASRRRLSHHVARRSMRLLRELPATSSPIRVPRRAMLGRIGPRRFRGLYSLASTDRSYIRRPNVRKHEALLLRLQDKRSPVSGNGLWTRRMLSGMTLCQAVHGWVCGVLLPQQDDVKGRDDHRGRRVVLLLRVGVGRRARVHHEQAGEDDHDVRIANRRGADDYYSRMSSFV